MKAHLELKRSEELRIRQERLSALGQLTSGIAHDFNNMLFSILGYSDLLLEKPDLLNSPDQSKRMLTSIKRATITSRDTIKQLQQFIRADTRPKIERVNIAALVSEVVEATKPLWTSGENLQSETERITADVPPDLAAVLSKSQFSEALMNLLLNALQAIADDGEVTIKAFEHDGTLTLQVRDTGIGMPQDVVKRCLEPFFSTKGKNGTGIGLAMVHGIVRRHNGSLNISSTPGEGTTIEMQIPVVNEIDEPEPVECAPSLSTRSLSALVVDDDDHARTLLAEYLELDGHRVTTAADAASGIESFDGGKFDLIVTDRAMPNVIGDKLVEHVKASSRHVPVLMVTGFAQIMAGRSEHPTGVDHTLGKPFTLQELRCGIESAFAAAQ